MKIGIDSHCFYRLPGYVSRSDKSSAPPEPISQREFRDKSAQDNEIQAVDLSLKRLRQIRDSIAS